MRLGRPEDARLLRISIDVQAADLAEAVAVGRREIAAAAQRVPLDGRLDEVVAMTEEGYRSWSA